MSKQETLEQARDAAAQQLLEARGVLAGWEAKREAAEAEFTRLQGVAGDQVLDDPDALDEIPRQMQELRDRIDMAERAIDAARDRVLAAERGYLGIEADLLEVEAAAARKALEKHQATTERLVAAVRKHEGPGEFVTEEELFHRREPHERLSRSYQSPVSAGLKAAVQRAELRVAVVRDVAAGVDPRERLAALQSLRDSTVAGVPVGELYPACVGPEGLVPAPGVSRDAEQAAQRETAEQPTVPVG